MDLKKTIEALLRPTRAVCAYWSGNDFDSKEGEIKLLEDLDITSVWRGTEEVSISDPEREGCSLGQPEIRNLLLIGDRLEDNCCHGQYVAF
jgi:hypothetical protein